MDRARGFPLVVAAPQSLAVDGDNPAADLLTQSVRPVAKTPGKELIVHRRKHPPKGIVGGDPLGDPG